MVISTNMNMRLYFVSLLLLLFLGCENQPKDGNNEGKKGFISNKFSTAKVKASLYRGLTKEQGDFLTMKYLSFKNIDSLEIWVDSIAPKLETGTFAVGGPATLTCKWSGYNNNLIIKTYNTGSVCSESQIMDYCRRFESQSKEQQNIYLYFFKENAPLKMPVAEYEKTDPENPRKTGSFAVLQAVKAIKPYATVTIFGNREYLYTAGFSE